MATRHLVCRIDHQASVFDYLLAVAGLPCVLDLPGGFTDAKAFTVHDGALTSLAQAKAGCASSILILPVDVEDESVVACMEGVLADGKVAALSVEMGGDHVALPCLASPGGILVSRSPMEAGACRVIPPQPKCT